MICWKHHLLASIGSEVLLYWLCCRSRMSQNKGSNRAAVFLLFVFCCLLCQNTLLWFIWFFCSGSRWTRNRRCNDICLIPVKCCFTLPPLPLAAVAAMMSASENVCFTFTPSLLCNYVNLMQFGRPKNSSHIYKNVIWMLPSYWMVVAGQTGFLWRTLNSF